MWPIVPWETIRSKFWSTPVIATTWTHRDVRLTARVWNAYGRWFTFRESNSQRHLEVEGGVFYLRIESQLGETDEFVIVDENGTSAKSATS